MKKFANKVKTAQALGELLHDDQMYGEGLPYRYHLQMVYATLLEFEVTDRDVLCAAFLHDAIEDRDVSPVLIEELLGPEVVRLVQAVTDEPGTDRKEKKAKTYPKIFQAGPKAIMLKLADRIANLKHAHSAKNVRMWKTYKKEQPEFASVVGYPVGNREELAILTRMWAKVDELLAKEPELPAPPPVKLEV